MSISVYAHIVYPGSVKAARMTTAMNYVKTSFLLPSALARIDFHLFVLDAGTLINANCLNISILQSVLRLNMRFQSENGEQVPERPQLK
ncbi:hypothetical protein DW714_08820 [Streptococcus anginosus]|nr:hypothetical protein DW714_08820 [Streptococcus anginosus]